MVPLWSPNLISFCFISPLENVFLTSIYWRYLLIFDLSIFLIWRTDGWVMGDGWWVMDGWVPKMFFDFAQNFFRWSSGDINVRKFGTSAKKFLYRKKSNFNFQKLGVFWSKKKFSDFSQIFVRWSSGDINVPHVSFFVTSCR